jgi:NAD(P)-dependent dehydrogenase (short-subunit alcohol dehydrogenase family)
VSTCNPTNEQATDWVLFVKRTKYRTPILEILMDKPDSVLPDKVALVTGAASRLGKKIALTFAKAGASVAIADLNGDGAEAVASQIRELGGSAIGVTVDVTNEDAVNTATDAVADKFGSVDILVSNAGIQIVNRWWTSPTPTGERCGRFTSTERS